jgi:hypothetical protein
MSSSAWIALEPRDGPKSPICRQRSPFDESFVSLRQSPRRRQESFHSANRSHRVFAVFRRNPNGQRRPWERSIPASGGNEYQENPGFGDLRLLYEDSTIIRSSPELPTNVTTDRTATVLMKGRQLKVWQEGCTHQIGDTLIKLRNEQFAGGFRE